MALDVDRNAQTPVFLLVFKETKSHSCKSISILDCWTVLVKNITIKYPTANEV
jgi:hypothetical protein